METESCFGMTGRDTVTEYGYYVIYLFIVKKFQSTEGREIGIINVLLGHLVIANIWPYLLRLDIFLKSNR